jgi:sirohydrochlorin ferrochelatase
MNALLLVDHGSRRAEANALLAQIAALVAARRPTLIVEIAHMELAPPTVDEAFDACVSRGATEVVVMPYFLARGRHATEDIPALARAAAARHPHVALRMAEPLGVHALLAELVLARADDAGAVASD